MDELTIINTDHMEPPKVGDDLYTNRAEIVRHVRTEAEVSIIVLAYNRLEKTKRCVSSVLQYTKGINFELILIDNGSTDDTLNYFKNVPYKNKRIIHITHNVGATYSYFFLQTIEFGKFVVSLGNDLIVTAHWLDNLLACANSDDKIGMVNPLSSHTSNLQGAEFSYHNYEEMQQRAASFNVSNPQKWEDRQRLITLGALLKKEVLLAIGWPVGDVGFFHDFGDDDLTFRIRRAGYRTVLAGDTWICHDHDIQRGEGRTPAELHSSLEIGRQNFRDKYFGIDAWDDVNNYYIPYLPQFPKPHARQEYTVLGIDVRCGTPILDIKNWLRKFGIFQTELSAFTQDSKYWLDLKTICKGQVICDREEFLADSFLTEYFDYVVADRPVNRYHEPQKILDDMFSLCKKGGFVVCKLTNTFSFLEYLNILGRRDVYNQEFSYHIPVEAFQESLQRNGTVCTILPLEFGLGEDDRKALDNLLPSGLSVQQHQEVFQRMQYREFLFVTQKK